MHDNDPQPVASQSARRPLQPQTHRPFMETITVGPLQSFFSNKNDEMGLKGHSHACNVTLEYRTLGSTGFPAFESTYRDLQERIKQVLGKPIRGTNEVVGRLLWQELANFSTPEMERWGGGYRLVKLTLGVLGVPDEIGHADGYTFYSYFAE